MSEQLTLGQLIRRLAALPADRLMQGLCSPHSYRGRYTQLALEPCHTLTVDEVLTTCRQAVGRRFCGYKGGLYRMGKKTPVWLACRGVTGRKIVGLSDDGQLELGPKPEYV